MECLLQMEHISDSRYLLVDAKIPEFVVLKRIIAGSDEVTKPNVPGG